MVSPGDGRLPETERPSGILEQVAPLMKLPNDYSRLRADTALAAL